MVNKEHIKRLIGRVLVLGSLMYLGYAVLGTMVKDFLIIRSGKCTKGVLIPEVTSVTHRYTTATLLYQFTYNGKVYSGNSLEKNSSLVGDSICVVFLESFPGINRQMNYFDKKKLHCDCYN